MIDKKLGYSTETKGLIDRMCKYVEREDFELNKKEAEERILKTYDLFNLKRPKNIIWCNDIFDNNFQNALDIAWSAWSAGSAGSARSARSAGSALDYDFYWYVFEYEYILNPDAEYPVNKNDELYKKYSNLLLEALEFGLGYRVEVEAEDTLYLAPTPIVKIDSQNRFHSTKEAAIRWKDGKELYYLNGVNFEKEWWTKIVNNEFTPEDIFAIDNLEHRRIAYEFMDKTKMKSLKDYKILDETTDGFGNPMKIISFSIKEVEEPLKYLNVFCPSTNREYFIGTEEDTCNQAKAKSFGFDESEIEFINEW